VPGVRLFTGAAFFALVNVAVAHALGVPPVPSGAYLTS
jgi:hypothetical protein